MGVQGAELTQSEYGFVHADHWIHREPKPFTVMHDWYVSRCVRLLLDHDVKRVVEMGCGDGWNCGKLVEAGFPVVVGVDWSPNGIEHCRRLVPKGEFFCGDLRRPEVMSAFYERFPDPFDACLFVEVLEHIPPADCVTALRNIMAPVRAGGVLVLTTPHENKPNTNPQHYRHFSESTLRALAGDAGLIVESIEGYGNEPAKVKYWRRMRWADNRLWTFKPLVNRLLRAYAAAIANPRPETAEGWVVVARKEGGA